MTTAQNFVDTFKPPYFRDAKIVIAEDNKDCFDIAGIYQTSLIAAALYYLLFR